MKQRIRFDNREIVECLAKLASDKGQLRGHTEKINVEFQVERDEKEPSKPVIFLEVEDAE